jgi:CheY-like chemotaxis protein
MGTSGKNGRPSSAAAPARTGRPNTIGMHERELALFLDSLDKGGNPKGAASRDFVRWPYRHASVRVKVLQPSGTVASLTLACRNISCGGISLLHNCYMHPGAPVMVMLPHPQSREKPVPGRVVRCTHRAGVIHEIGVAFVRPVDLRDLLRPEPLTDFYCLEHVRPGDLKGTVLYIEDTDADTRLVKQFLRGTGVTLKIAGSVADGLASLEPAPDLVLCDFQLPDGTAADLIAKARERGYAGPLVVLTADATEESKRRMTEVRANAAFVKPLTQERLLRAVAEFLVVRLMPEPKGEAPGTTEAPAQEFASALKEQLKRLIDGIKAGDAAACRAACLQISGGAPAAGLHPLADLARETALSLAGAQGLAGSKDKLKALIEACEQSGARKAA